jgi:hypothetical protein
VIWHYEWVGQADVIRSVADVAAFMKALDFE